MDSTTFDGIARTFGSTSTRRTAVRGLFAGAIALVGGAAVLEADAKRRKKGKKGRNQQQGQFLPTGALCQNDGQCDFRGTIRSVKFLRTPATPITAAAARRVPSVVA